MKNVLSFETVVFNKESNVLNIVDQTKLPNSIDILSLETVDDVWNAIKILAVRGAPAIGVAASYGIYMGARKILCNNYYDFLIEYERLSNYLASSRPTAVNLCWALDRMLSLVKANSNLTPDFIIPLLLKEADAIRDEDIQMCARIGEYGLSLLKPKMGILTHCNAGQLATIRYGTATAPMYLGFERGYDFKIFCDETRPLLQGARLTAFELSLSGMDVTLLCDNMAATLMKQGKIDAVFTGADRVSSNGDSANKIGTLGVAILAKHFGIPFYICAPSSTIDFTSFSGSDIIIEERDPFEVSSMWYKEPMVPKKVQCYNPAFDVTDACLITAIITDKGIAYPPFSDSLKHLVVV